MIFVARALSLLLLLLRRLVVGVRSGIGIDGELLLGRGRSGVAASLLQLLQSDNVSLQGTRQLLLLLPLHLHDAALQLLVLLPEAPLTFDGIVQYSNGIGQYCSCSAAIFNVFGLFVVIRPYCTSVLSP